MLIHQIERIVQTAFAKVFPDADITQARLRPCLDPKFGDYQMVAIMPLAKSLKTNPRALANQLMEELSLEEYCEKIEVAGPGFINFHLKTERINEFLTQAADAEGVQGLVPDRKSVV